jgi:hypothetical protein
MCHRNVPVLKVPPAVNALIPQNYSIVSLLLCHLLLRRREDTRYNGVMKAKGSHQKTNILLVLATSSGITACNPSAVMWTGLYVEVSTKDGGSCSARSHVQGIIVHNKVTLLQSHSSSSFNIFTVSHGASPNQVPAGTAHIPEASFHALSKIACAPIAEASFLILGEVLWMPVEEDGTTIAVAAQSMTYRYD